MRILFVGFPDSIHVVRWTHQIAGQGWDVHVFPSTGSPLHKDFRNITTYGFGSFRPKELHASVRWKQLWPYRGLSRLSMRLGVPAKLSDRSMWLARVVRRLRPDVVHSLEFQHSAYLTFAAKAHLPAGTFPTWVVSNWGSDIYLFGRLAAHKQKISEILSQCDYYHCECHRDLGLARALGLRGESLPVFPVTGGLDTKDMQRHRTPGATSERRVIALKGYQNWSGRALVGLRAIELVRDRLKDYTVCVYMPNADTILAAELLRESMGIRVEISPPTWKRDDILRMHGRARISVGLSISDAISTSLLEAMTLGSFPIQSNTGCGDEWIKCGDNGILVQPESPDQVAAALEQALENDDLVDRAAETNLRIISERADVSVLKPKIIDMYKTIVTHSRR